jgi:Spy/CpxP family protein refolding chaperone
MRWVSLSGSVLVLALGLSVAGVSGARPPFGGHRPDGGHHRDHGPERFIEEHAAELGLDDETRQAIDQIVGESQERARELHVELRDLHRAMRDLLSQDAPDESAVMQQAEAIGSRDRAYKHRLGALIRIGRCSPKSRGGAGQDPGGGAGAVAEARDPGLPGRRRSLLPRRRGPLVARALPARPLRGALSRLPGCPRGCEERSARPPAGQARAGRDGRVVSRDPEGPAPRRGGGLGPPTVRTRCRACLEGHLLVGSRAELDGGRAAWCPRRRRLVPS